MRDDCCCGPSRRGMVRRERIATLEEVEASLIRRGPLSAERVFKSLRCKQTVKDRLAGEYPCLSFVLIVRDIAPDIRTSAHADEGHDAII